MTTRDQNPPDPTKPPLDEATMLDWIEGRLSRIEESNLASGARAGLATRVKQMQANQRALRSLGSERAPADLLEHVLAALERDALLGLANGAPVQDHLPISIAEPLARRDSARRARLVPRLALAAGIVLLAAGGIYIGTVALRPSPKPITISQTTPPAPAPHFDEPRLAKAETSPLLESREVLLPPVEPARTAASGAAESETGAALALASSGGPAESVVDPINSSRAADSAASTALADTPLSDDMDEARAVELARQGRLVIRVLATDTASLADLEESASARLARPWYLTRDVPPSVVAAVMPVFQPVIGPVPRDGLITPAFASANPRGAMRLISPMLGPGAAAGWPFAAANDPAFRIKGTYLVDVAATLPAVAEMTRTFANRLHATIVYEELPASLEVPANINPEVLMWWTQSPSAWVQRVSIPVVVEQR